MITMSKIDLEAILKLFQLLHPVSEKELNAVLEQTQCHNYSAGQFIVLEGDEAQLEFIVLEGDEAQLEFIVLRGIVKSGVTTAEGQDVALNFYPGPAVVSPAITRYAEGKSRVHLQALTDTRIAFFPAQTLVNCMLASTSVQLWGDSILRADLVKRADKEWALAALSGKERLARFRLQFPTLENDIGHSHIASYLGMTPVTLSRLRGNRKD